ncbi:MAG TPA: hypothetical protein ENI80_01515 [Acidiferrobacteraceae bacterium]|nr:hypothetical protein [Acidiferrobacteraceae bacterium]
MNQLDPSGNLLGILSGHLASEGFTCPKHWQEHDWRRYLALAQSHGILPLIQDRLLNADSAAQPPSPIGSAIEQDLKNQAVLEILQTLELQRVLSAFSANDIPVLVFKGGALAHSHYSEAKLRPRNDTDLLILETQRKAAATILKTLAYTAQNVTTGRHIMHQCNYEYTDHQGCPHAVDLHWHLSNPAAFYNLLNFEDLWKRAARIPQLTKDTRCPCQVDALLIACIHRLAHHHHNDRLIWLMDIHLLVEAISDAEAKEFILRAHQIGVVAVCRQGLELSRDCLHTHLSPVLTDFLKQSQNPTGKTERYTRRYIIKGRGRWDDFLDDLRAQPNWRSRLGYLRETFFPNATYLLRSYNTRHRILLPVLYLHRLLRGFIRFVRSR